LARFCITIVAAIAAMPLMWEYGMHDYQRTRVLTLLDPTKDPLGAGYHILQSMIAIGSGGVWGKGWLNGTQTHLDYIPESTTDFIFAVFGEEFGLVGNLIALVVLYLFIVSRGLLISARAPHLV
jgi:rod shape determining protein RodA